MKFTAPQDLLVLEALTQMSPESSKNTLRSWIEKQRVFVDGKVVHKADVQVLQGQEVTIGKRPRFAYGDIRILYEDRQLVVIDKPAGLLSVATDYDVETTAHSILKRRYYSQKVFPVHRLDRETSGVMLFAYTEVARDYFKEKFYHHDIQREYCAVVEGRVKAEKGTWQSYLYEDQTYRVMSSAGGRLSITHYEVMAANNQYSRLKLTLETGRKNQIRVHCAEAGYPVIGDKKYGSEKTHAGRLCLHAHKLGFVHPISSKCFLFESVIPDVFFKLIP